MPPTAFAEVVAGLNLGFAQRDAISELLRIKTNAKEKERIVPVPDLDPLLVDGYEALAKENLWGESGDRAELMEGLTKVFQGYLIGLKQT